MRNNRFVYGEGQYSYAKRPQPELWNEYREYIVKNKLDKNERKLLRDWIKDGHSVYEIVESRYLPGPAYPPMDLIDAYRLDCSISDDIEGMTKEEKERYLKEMTGWEEADPANLTIEKVRRSTTEIREDPVRRLKRELFNLWHFVWREGLGDEAREFVEERKDDEIPFEW